MSSYHNPSRAAVYLNNVGIDLLKRGCHRQAMETLTDAVEVIQVSCANQDKRNSDISFSLPASLNGREFSIKIEEMIYNAAKRLSQAISATPQQLQNMVPEIISDDHDPVQIMTQVSTVSYLIRLETVDLELSNHEHKATEASIILYNYAVTFQILASLNTSLPIRTKLYLGALQMLRLSFATVFPLHWSSSESNVGWSSRGCLSAILILSKLVGLTQLLEMSTESGQYREHLDHLNTMVRGSGTNTEVNTHHARAA